MAITLSFDNSCIQIRLPKLLQYLVIIVLLFIPSSVQAQHPEHGDIASDERHQWVEQMVKGMNEINPLHVEARTEMKRAEEESSLLYYFDLKKASIVQISPDQWVYLLMHSGHDNEHIGDLTLGRDQDGNVYYHLGHVCGEISFEARTNDPILTSKEFFESFVDSAEDLPWEPLPENHMPKVGHSHD